MVVGEPATASNGDPRRVGAHSNGFFSHISTAHYWYPLARSRASPFLLVEGGARISVDTIWQFYLRRVSSGRAVVSRPPYIVGGGREGGRRISFPSRRAGRFLFSSALFYSMCVWAASYGRWGTVVGGEGYGRSTVVGGIL